MISELTGRQQEALLYLGEGCPALQASEKLDFRAREGRSPNPFLLSFVGAKPAGVLDLPNFHLRAETPCASLPLTP